MQPISSMLHLFSPKPRQHPVHFSGWNTDIATLPQGKGWENACQMPPQKMSVAQEDKFKVSTNWKTLLGGTPKRYAYHEIGHFLTLCANGYSRYVSSVEVGKRNIVAFSPFSQMGDDANRQTLPHAPTDWDAYLDLLMVYRAAQVMEQMVYGNFYEPAANLDNHAIRNGLFILNLLDSLKAEQAAIKAQPDQTSGMEALAKQLDLVTLLEKLNQAHKETLEQGIEWSEQHIHKIAQKLKLDGTPETGDTQRFRNSLDKAIQAHLLQYDRDTVDALVKLILKEKFWDKQRVEEIVKAFKLDEVPTAR